MGEEGVTGRLLKVLLLMIIMCAPTQDQSKRENQKDDPPGDLHCWNLHVDRVDNRASGPQEQEGHD